MRLAQFITANTKRIISEWEEFARLHLIAASKMDLKQRRDHVEGMLETIAADLDTPQSKREQASKATGKDDESVGSNTAANAHGTDRAATGFSPIDVVSEFRSLRASVLRLWSEAQSQFSREDLEEVTRFNVVVAVHNKGHRIPKSRLHDIFNPFNQLDPSSTKPKDARSVGLGLYIVQAIVTAHEGTIDVESNERGTTFTLRLPRTPNETESSASSIPQLALH